MGITYPKQGNPSVSVTGGGTDTGLAAAAYGTAAEWTATNPVLAKGELGYETDTYVHKVGDGSTAWASLSSSGGTTYPALTGSPLPSAQAGVLLSDRIADVLPAQGLGDRTVVQTPTNGGFEGTLNQEPQVWYYNSLWHMYYSGNNKIYYAHATAPQGPWTKNGAWIVGDGNGGEGAGVSALHSGIYIDTAASRVYLTWTDGTHIKLGWAPLSSPTTFTNLGTIFALAANGGGTQFGNSMIVKDGSTFYLFYESDIDNWQSGYATATAITGTYTRVTNQFSITVPSHSAAAGPGSTVGNMWVIKEDSRWVAVFHSGPKVSGSLPTALYRATSPDLSTWTLDNNGWPILDRLHPVEVDQVADPCIAVGPYGDKWLFYDGYDNAQSWAYCLCTPLLPQVVRHDGAAWRRLTPDQTGARGSNDPGKPSFTELATDKAITSTSFVTVLSGTFTPSGTKAACTIDGAAALPGSSAITKYQFLQGATAKGIGQLVGAGNQMPVMGTRVFTGLTPGHTYTFAFQIKVESGTWYCRPAAFPDAESLTLKIEDVAYPSSIS